MSTRDPLGDNRARNANARASMRFELVKSMVAGRLTSVVDDENVGRNNDWPESAMSLIRFADAIIDALEARRLADVEGK